MQSVSSFDFDTVLLSEENAHLLVGFKCGKYGIDKYIQENALSESTSGKGVTYLVIDNEAEIESNKLIAYYTLRATSLLYIKEPDISDKNNIDEVIISGIPSIEIKMFAVSLSFQDVPCLDEFGEEIYVSDHILRSVINRIYEMSVDTLGAEMITLYSVPDANKFYDRNYFQPLYEYRSLDDEYTKDCLPMYMRLFNYNN